MQLAILVVCVAAVTAKPHVQLDYSKVASTESETGNSKLIRGYQGPPAPLDGDGRVVDTVEVAQLKAERIAALNKAIAEAEAAAAAHVNDEARYQDIPTNGQAEHTGNVGFLATIGHDGRVIDTEEIAKLNAEYLATFAEAQAKTAALATTSFGSSSSTNEFSFETPAAQVQRIYIGPAAPLGQDGRVVDTDEVTRLKDEHIATLEKAYAAAAASVAPLSSSSFKDLSYEVPVEYIQTALATNYRVPAAPVQPQQIHEVPVQKIQDIPVFTYSTPAPQLVDIYSGPLAPLGEHGRVIDTEEVAKLKAEHLATLQKANDEAAAVAVKEAALDSSSFNGYTYEAPIPKTVVICATIHGAPADQVQPQPIYNGPPAPIGQDGLATDTEEVAKLKAEHLATLQKANDDAAAVAVKEAALDSSSFNGYTYEAPIPKTKVICATIHGAPADQVQPQPIYNGPPAPIGQDGLVTDTEEVAKLKAEHLATLQKANDEAAAVAVKEAALESSSFNGYTYEAPILKTVDIPATIYGEPIVPMQLHQVYNEPIDRLRQDERATNSATVSKIEQTYTGHLSSPSSTVEVAYTAQPDQQSQKFVESAPIITGYSGPLAPLTEDGRVADTDEVAKLKSDHLATLAKATTDAIAGASAKVGNLAQNAAYSLPLPAQHRFKEPFRG